MSLNDRIIKMLKDAKEASFALANISTKEKNKALYRIADSLLKNTQYILKENSKDMVLADKTGLSEHLLDRLLVTEKRIKEMSDSLKEIASLKDPVGKILEERKRPNGLTIKKISTPIGVIAIIYESRPNVTSDSAGLCIKSGNACVLRGGSEAINSNLAIHNVITKCLQKSSIPESAVTMIDVSTRRAVEVLLKESSLIDVVIPRGGEGLIRYVAENSLIPVIKHYKGVCHLYVDKEADFKMAMDIMLNAKVQRPGVCNAIEKMLVHKDIARKFLPQAAKVLDDKGVELRGCPETLKIVKLINPDFAIAKSARRADRLNPIGFNLARRDNPKQISNAKFGIKKATEKDWYEEYLDLIITIKVVKNVDEAISHINKYGSKHSDAIVTKNKLTAGKFLKEVDSACVYYNSSTRFTDGYQFGMGAEIGISTDKIHARGPMALEELCIYKYTIYGTGQTRG